MPVMNVANQTYKVYQVFYKNNSGEKRYVFKANRSEAGKYRKALERSKRKFLGFREVELAEIV